MIEYAKKILPKVSPWKPLFTKELKKCIQWIDPQDHDDFYQWCHHNFYGIYPDVVTDAFKQVNVSRMSRKIPGVNIKAAFVASKKSELQKTA